MPAILTMTDILQMIDRTTAKENMTAKEAMDWLEALAGDVESRIEALQVDIDHAKVRE